MVAAWQSSIELDGGPIDRGWPAKDPYGGTTGKGGKGGKSMPAMPSVDVELHPSLSITPFHRKAASRRATMSVVLPRAAGGTKRGARVGLPPAAAAGGGG